MAEHDEFFLPEEVDRQIESVSQSRVGDLIDAKALAYIRSYYQTDSRQEQETLNRIWSRIAGATFVEQDSQESEKELAMQQPHMQYDGRTMSSSREAHPRRAALMQRLGVLAAALVLLAVVGSMAMVFCAVRHTNGGVASPHPTATLPTVHVGTVTPHPTPTHTTTQVPLKVTSISMSVTPESIANIACGTNLTVTYTALFQVSPHSFGGTVHFNYTVNNGRGQTPANITLHPGETSKSYTFTWSGALPVDHTYPGPGGVQVTSPNQLTSQLVAPTGKCS